MWRVGKIFVQIYLCANPGEAPSYFFFLHCVSQLVGTKIVSKINDPGKITFRINDLKHSAEVTAAVMVP